MKITDNIRDEMMALRKRHNDLLQPAHVVAYAKRAKNSAIRQWMNEHGAFDPERALAEYAKDVARRLIMRVHVVIPDTAGKVTHVRGYVSLSEDRRQGGGYRDMIEVLSSGEMREQLMATARGELLAFERKYEKLERFGDERFAAVIQAIRALSVDEAKEEAA